MGNIRIYNKEEKQYSKLKILASIIEYVVRNVYDANVTIEVEETYFDFGQDWKWTTLIAYRGNVSNNDTYQMLSPKHMDMLTEANDIKDITNIAYDIITNQIGILAKGY